MIDSGASPGLLQNLGLVPWLRGDEPIRGQFSGHVTSIDQSEASIYLRGDELGHPVIPGDVTHSDVELGVREHAGLAVICGPHTDPVWRPPALSCKVKKLKS